MRIDFTVTPQLDGITVGEFLKKQQLSRRLIIALKQVDMGITRNGEQIRVIDPVHAGDIITVAMADQTEIEPNPSLSAEVVYDDDQLVIFNKPSDMPVHPSHRHRTDTLANLYAHLYPGLTFRAVNRLDRDTTGLCVVAKTPFCANALQGGIAKVYYALAEGDIALDGRIDAPIAREQESIITRCVRSDGQRAVTNYRVLKRYGNRTLLEIRLETGRTHQIRVHFAHIGHPLVGDSLYGQNREEGCHMLHCGQVSFVHPITGNTMSFSAPPPEGYTKEKKMKKIASFQVDHTKFGVGMYISRIDGDIYTYDVRMVKPNGGAYLSSPSMHTIEHLFATYARSSFMEESVIYVGPMGCRTGFYLLVRDPDGEKAIRLVKEALEFIGKFEGTIPGYSEIECGNWLEHDLESAKKDILPLLEVLKNWQEKDLVYPV